MIGAAPKIVPLAPASDAEKEEEAEEFQDELGSEAEAEIREAVQDLDRIERGAEASEVAVAVSPPKESVRQRMDDKLLHIDEPVLMSDQEVMDKALIAIGIVAPNGYAKKKEASDSIIIRLGIKKFIKEVSGGTYTSVEGAMRALTMALRGAGYIERVHYTAGDGSVSDGIKGYKLTPKGLKRIQSLSGEMKPFASIALEAMEEEAEKECSDEPREIKDENWPGEQREGGLNSEDLPRLKSLIAEHEEADLQLKEIDGILGNLDSEIADIGLDETALDLAEREKTKQMEILQAEIQRIRDKKASAAEKLERKRRERREWEEMKSPHVSEKARVEAEICSITGRNKT
ncbi:MAG: hypothetical protein EBU90_29860 [Proteobacteria bacterium]|nr:hypothetical protein [Pseudomonadota bacterium]